MMKTIHYTLHTRSTANTFKQENKLEPDGTEEELVPGFRVSVLRKAKMQLFHN